MSFVFLIYTKNARKLVAGATKLSTRCSIGQKDMLKNGQNLFYSVFRDTKLTTVPKAF